MIKKFLKILLIVLTLIISLFLFINYDFVKNKISNIKLRNIIPQKYTAIIEKKSSEFIDFQFNVKKEKNFIVDGRKIKYENYSNRFLKHRYYLAQNKANIFAVTKRGELFYFSKADVLNNKKFKLKKIKTNLDKIIGKDYISEYNTVIKGVMIIDESIYISFLHNKSKCFSNAILKGNLNKTGIKFSHFFNIDECKERFLLAVGGNMYNIKNNKILLTIGDHESYELAFEDDPQNINSYYGKVLSIDLKTKKSNILSMGHRNQQGLFYDSKEDIIFMTEHGPQGGDEINVNINPKSNEIKNYGWAIASYGEHYGFPKNYSQTLKDNEDLKNEDLKNELYKIAPLNKSHSEHGFVEPIKFFDPSIGITQILKVNNSKRNEHKLLIGSLGWGDRVDDMTVHMIDFDNNFNETKYNKIRINERIRDIIDLQNGSVLMSLETSDSFGLLKNVYLNK